MPARLIDTGPIIYIHPGHQPTWRHCRTWVTPDGSTVSIVTELPSDTGMSITNAAEEVRAALEATWGEGCRIIEHYPWPGDEHYDEQSRDAHGEIRWRRLDIEELRAELGSQVEHTRPGEPIGAAKIDGDQAPHQAPGSSPS